MKKLVFVISLFAVLTGCKKQSFDFKPYFKSFQGAFVLYNSESKQYTFYNKSLCETRFSPCSTFKILNSLIALETGVIRNENEIIQWDGKQREYPGWNQNNHLQSAFKYSVVWFYQELAKRVGEERMKKFIQSINYGNNDINGGLTLFWLKRPESKLKISPLEQVEFLKKFYFNQLPFNRRNIDTVKKIMVLTKTKNSVLSGKTGSGMEELPAGSPTHQKVKPVLGHFVGYVEKNNKTYFFAVTITGKGAMGPAAKEIAISILKGLKLL